MVSEPPTGKQRVVVHPFPEPWTYADQELRGALEGELSAEISEGHVLFGRDAAGVAQCGGCDDAVFAVQDVSIRWAVVHLTWSGHGEQPPFPETTVAGTVPDLMAQLNHHTH
jgi:hypothetical protein